MKETHPGQPVSVAIMGPHRLFLHYVSAVLPALGHTDARHTTFEDWFVQWSGEPGLRFRPRDAELEEMLDTSRDRRDRVVAFHRAKLKSSLRMGDVLHRRAEALRQEMTSRLCAAPMPVRAHGAEGTAASLVIDQRTLSAVVRGLQPGPLNVQRTQAQAELWRLVQARLLPEGEAGGHVSAAPQDSLPASVEREFVRRWPPASFLGRYFELLADESILRDAANGILEPREQKQLRAQPAASAQVPRRPSATGETRTQALEDLAPLSYLCLLLNGPAAGKDGAQSFQHVVVDEAQDLAPLQFKVLRAHTTGMTILGDVAQGIHSYRGIATWDELQPIFADQRILQTELRHSYRSTRRLVEFANAVLQQMPVTGVSPAVHRDHAGAAPVVCALAWHAEPPTPDSPCGDAAPERWDYCPVKWGTRFSRKARTPSAKSAVRT